MQPKATSRQYRSPSRSTTSPNNNTTSPTRPLSKLHSQGTPHFIQCILLFVVMVIIIGLVVTFRAHIPGVDSIPNIPSDYSPSYTTNNDISHPSHIDDVHDIIDKLEIHQIDPPQQEQTNIKMNTDQSQQNIQCGDIEATRRIFNNLKVINDKSKIHIWPLPQSYTIFEDIVSINVKSLQYESNVDHPIITKAIERYKAIIFPHRTRREYKENADTINKVKFFALFPAIN